MKALVRKIPDSYPLALAATVPDPPIDLQTARDQHFAYRQALEDLGLEVVQLDAQEDCPDCCFIEDTAVVASGLAVITRPGAPSRRAEPRAVSAALTDVDRMRIKSPGLLDGGDVLRLGTTFYVGHSSRTNRSGMAQLADAFKPRGYKVESVELPPGVLHLKSVCSLLGDGRVLLAKNTVPVESLGGAQVVWVPYEEKAAANVVSLGKHVIVGAEFPRTQFILSSERFALHPVPTTEARKADGALTCQSILYEPAARGASPARRRASS